MVRIKSASTSSVQDLLSCPSDADQSRPESVISALLGFITANNVCILKSHVHIIHSQLEDVTPGGR